jgi:hypothetical protein
MNSIGHGISFRSLLFLVKIVSKYCFLILYQKHISPTFTSLPYFLIDIKKIQYKLIISLYKFQIKIHLI